MFVKSLEPHGLNRRDELLYVRHFRLSLLNNFYCDKNKNFKTRLISRGYHEKMVERSSRKITSRQENSSSKKNPTTHRKLLPFVTQFQPSLPCTKNKLMDQWHLIQDQPSLRGIFKQPPLSLIETENRLKTCLLKQNFKGCERHNGYTAGVV